MKESVAYYLSFNVDNSGEFNVEEGMDLSEIEISMQNLNTSNVFERIFLTYLGLSTAPRGSHLEEKKFN